MSTYGEFAIKGGVGIALAGAGGSFQGAALAGIGATGGFAYGSQTCSCP